MAGQNMDPVILRKLLYAFDLLIHAPPACVHNPVTLMATETPVQQMSSECTS